ncbi:MAG: type II toxin-antitoxin system death-on-curing family toxin [Azospirillaceae bacterium]
MRWLSRAIIMALHHESIARYGGADGIRDEGLLESALGRPLNLSAYDPEASIFDLAAYYCAGVVKNHPFVDGNKRTGLLAARTFLTLNGIDFEPDDAETVVMIEGLAAGTYDEDTIARWLESNSAQLR